MWNNKNLRGFTLIELLVVIAIIGILAGIVLTSLSSAREKAKAASVKSTMSSMRSAMEIYYTTKGNYGDPFTVASGKIYSSCTQDLNVSGFNTELSNMKDLIDSVNQTNGTGGISCGISQDGQLWSVAAALPGGGFYCVDSTGVSRSTNADGDSYTSLETATISDLLAAHHNPGGIPPDKDPYRCN